MKPSDLCVDKLNGSDTKTRNIGTKKQGVAKPLSRKTVEFLEKELLTMQKRTLIRDKEACDVAEATNDRDGIAIVYFKFHQVQ